MSGLYVPQLRRKLELLVAYGHYASLNDIAARLGRSWITVKGWINDADGTAPDTITQPNVAAVIGLFVEALPELEPAHVRDILVGPAEDLESLLQIGVESSLQSLLLKEGETNSAELFREEKRPDEHDLGLVRRVRRAEPAPQYRVQLGEAFRLEYTSRSRAAFVVGLQAAPGGWGVIDVHIERAKNRIYMPGAHPQSESAFVAEDNEVGRHRFIVAQGEAPFPKALHEAGRNHVGLNLALLAHFERSYRSQPKATRKLFLTEIEFFR